MDAAASVGGTGKVASLAAVDAYKTYLYRRGNRSVADIEGSKDGQLIDLTDLNRDIAATESLKHMCDTNGIPSYDIVYKLKSLRALREQLVGRTWPSFSEIKQQAKDAATIYDLAQKSYKDILFAQAKAELEEQKAKNAPLVKKKPGVYNAKPVKIAPFQKPIAAIKLEQEWIMRVGMVSNLNVSILQTVAYGYVTLRCKVCALDKTVANSVVSGADMLTVDIEQFCRDHRHDQKPDTQPKGRLFRDED